MTDDHDNKLRDELREALTSSLPADSNLRPPELSPDQIDRILAPITDRPAAPRHRPWLTVITCTALAAAIAITLIILNQPAPPTPVTIAPPAPPVPTAPPAFSPVTITTGPTEKRRIDLPDGSTLFVRENSSITQTAHRQLDLTRGEIYLQVAKDPEGKTFDVITPDRRVTALGTRFAVAVEPAGTSVLVTQGKVEATGAPSPLVAGQKLSAADAKITPAPRYDLGLAWTRDLVTAAGPAIVPSSDYAGAALVSTNPDGPDHRFTLRKLHIDVHIEDGFARTTIDQTYFNHLNRRLEGTFYFPLPADASISRLAMYVGENLMEGGMAERNHARQTFETIKHKMQDPALLEWMDGSTFRMRVFPLEARQEKRIIISYTQHLGTDSNATTYRFPAGHSQQHIDNWSLNIRARNAAAQKWHSPSHHLTATTDSSDLVLTASEENHTPHRDIVLHLDPPESPPAVRTATQDNWTYLLVNHAPTLPPPPPHTPRRDWIVLLETSGDRTPALARTAVEILRTIAENVDHADTITLVTADTSPTVSDPAAAPAPELLTTAENVHLLGALDLGSAFTKIAALAPTLDNPVILHLGTATPVLGERETAPLVEILPATTPYIGVGIGKSWNRNLMRTAATRSSGITTNINPDQPVNWAAFQLLSTLNAPRITDIAVTDDHQNTYLNLTDTVSLGQRSLAITRFPTDAELPTTITVNNHPVPVTNITTDAAYLPRTWAKLEIDRLVATGAEQNRDRIVTLSKASYVVSPFTSLLVLENDEMYTQYNIDRGRKDHWALYPCPEKIEVVHEPLQNNTPDQPDAAAFAALASWCPLSSSETDVPLPALFDTLHIAYPKPPLIWAGTARYDRRIPILSTMPRLGRLFRAPDLTSWYAFPVNTISSPTLGGVPVWGRVSDGNFESDSDSWILGNDYFYAPSRYTIDLNLQPEVVEFDGFINYQPRSPSSFSRGGTASRGRGNRISAGFIPLYRPTHNLLAFAPAFTPTLADALTLANAEAKLPPSFKPGQVDPAARALIDAARAQLPAAAKLTSDGSTIATFHTISPETITYSHTTPTGLTEHVTYTAETITHAYPDLALAASRTNSPFHRLDLFARFPFLLPTADDLATNATVTATDATTVTVTCGSEPALTLTFTDDSRLASVTRHTPEETTIDLNADTTPQLTPIPPTPAPDTSNLFTLPVPARTDLDDPLHHLAGHIFDDPTTIQIHIASDYFAKADRHIGLYTLLFNGSPSYQSSVDVEGKNITFDPLLDHPGSPLANFIAAGHRLAAGDSLAPPTADAPDNFINRLSRLRYLRWAIADESRYTDLDTLFLSTTIDPAIAPALASDLLAQAHPHQEKLAPATLQLLANTAATLFAQHPSDLQSAALQIDFLSQFATSDEVSQAIEKAIATVPDPAISALLSIHLRTAADLTKDLDAPFAQLVATDPEGILPAFWQQAAALAEQHTRVLDAVTFHQRAADAFYANPADVPPATFFTPLIKAQTTAAKAMVHLQQKPDQSFIDSVIKNADRWRSQESDNPKLPCNAAAECLETLGRHDLAWRYRTNDLAHHPREKSSWLTLAQQAASLDRPTFAHHAYTTAFSLEETNATTLLQHAQFLITQNRIAEARTLLEKITTSTWGPDYKNTVQQATSLLARPPLTQP